MTAQTDYTGPISKNEFHYLRADQRFLVRELLTRGAKAELLDYQRGIVKISLAGRDELLFDIDSSIISPAASMTASAKHLAKELITRIGISCAPGAVFSFARRYEALNFADELGYPCVLKPVVGVHGEGVQTDIYDAVELDQAIESFYLEFGSAQFLIEKQIRGEEFRVFLTQDGWYTVLQREPAFVIGNGTHTITELTHQENSRRQGPNRNALCPIVLDEIADKFLRKSELSLDYIPKLNQKVVLRGNANLLTGGYCKECSARVHPSVVEICRKVLNCFSGMPYAGIDFISADIGVNQYETNYCVLEVNPMPSIAMHMGPAEGAARNTAAVVADMIFPETRSLTKTDSFSPIPEFKAELLGTPTCRSKLDS